MSGAYFIRPKADRDLDAQAYYLATEASPEVGHRFFLAAHETFALLGRVAELKIEGEDRCGVPQVWFSNLGLAVLLV